MTPAVGMLEIRELFRFPLARWQQPTHTDEKHEMEICYRLIDEIRIARPVVIKRKKINS